MTSADNEFNYNVKITTKVIINPCDLENDFKNELGLNIWFKDGEKLYLLKNKDETPESCLKKVCLWTIIDVLSWTSMEFNIYIEIIVKIHLKKNKYMI